MSVQVRVKKMTISVLNAFIVIPSTKLYPQKIYTIGEITQKNITFRILLARCGDERARRRMHQVVL